MFAPTDSCVLGVRKAAATIRSVSRYLSPGPRPFVSNTGASRILNGLSSQMSVWKHTSRRTRLSPVAEPHAGPSGGSLRPRREALWLLEAGWCLDLKGREGSGCESRWEPRLHVQRPWGRPVDGTCSFLSHGSPGAEQRGREGPRPRRRGLPVPLAVLPRTSNS